MAWSSNAWKSSNWYDNDWKSISMTASGKGKADDPSGKGKADEITEEMKQARIKDIEARVIELADEQWTCVNFSIRLEGQKYAEISKQKIAAIPEIADEETLLYIENTSPSKQVTLMSTSHFQTFEVVVTLLSVRETSTSLQSNAESKW